MPAPQAMPLIAIVTLNWNRPGDTLECLASAAAQTYPHTTIVVVDNGSSDDSVARIGTAYPEAVLLRNERNMGFAAGANRGIAHALGLGAEYVFLINNDTTFAPDTVAQLLAKAAPDIGIVVPAIFYAAAPERPWS